MSTLRFKLVEEAFKHKAVPVADTQHQKRQVFV